MSDKFNFMTCQMGYRTGFVGLLTGWLTIRRTIVTIYIHSAIYRPNDVMMGRVRLVLSGKNRPACTYDS